MMDQDLFKGRQFETVIILTCMRWYLRYSLSYRDVAELMAERGLAVDHSTIYRWVQAYSPEVHRRIRHFLRPTSGSWRVDETYVKVRGKWMYLYRAVDKYGETVEFMLSAKRDAAAAKRFFRRALKSPHNDMPYVITVDKNAAYPVAISELKEDEVLEPEVELRQVKYLNNVVEQDHRRIKRLVKPGLGFKGFRSAVRTLKGYESMAMIRKGQVKGLNRGARSEADFFNSLFGIQERVA
jgi:transposase-like protein